jgi:hypothetical protein
MYQVASKISSSRFFRRALDKGFAESQTVAMFGLKKVRVSAMVLSAIKLTRIKAPIADAGTMPVAHAKGLPCEASPIHRS